MHDYQSHVMNTPCIDLANAAALLGVDSLTLRRYVKNGEIECLHYGRVYRFSPNVIIAWYESKRLKSAPRPLSCPFSCDDSYNDFCR